MNNFNQHKEGPENRQTSQPINLSTSQLIDQAVNLSTSQLINYTLHLADNNLILSQQNSAWCGHGPILEQDIALTNITLDLIGQARNFYQYAATLMGGDATEDSLAYLRTERAFKNCLLTEQPNGDWGQTILRQMLFSNYQMVLYTALQNSSVEQLAAISEKAIKEVAYHMRWSNEWVVRLGDGTAHSHDRMQEALNTLWPYTGELFEAADYENDCANAGITLHLASLKPTWETAVQAVLQEATLDIPATSFMQTGGKSGIHSEHLGYILPELQYLQRAYPGCEW